jgi:hypothetical protein
VRRAFAAIDEDEGAVWVRRHLDYCTAPLLAEPWILDIDTTVKPLQGDLLKAEIRLILLCHKRNRVAGRRGVD